LLGKATDFIGLAATGTGKTAAFSIPMLEQIHPEARTVKALILCPTRELALQVTGQINLLGKYKGMKAQAIYGGASYRDQIDGLKGGAQIVVGTPGRLVDHIERGTLKLENITHVILDEADEMISMGFKEDLETILGATDRQNSQIWLFSATMSRDVRKVADKYLDQPVHVQINKVEVLPSTITQLYYITRESDKPEILCKMIDVADDFYGIIFCQTKALVQDLATYLMERGYKVDSLHGDKDQKSRERTMQAFRDHRIKILVCTDVASRGLDVKDVTHVINYSIPRELDSYVHRIGRTARSGKNGFAMNLVTPSQQRLIYRLEEITKSRMQKGEIPSRKQVGTKRVSQILPKFQTQKFSEKASELLDDSWKALLLTMSKEEIAGRFLAMMNPALFNDHDENRAKMPGPRPQMHQDFRKNDGRNNDRRDNRRGRDERRDDRRQGRQSDRGPKKQFGGNRPFRRDKHKEDRPRY
jgi:ATP-dependent RNA helicase DeaD